MAAEEFKIVVMDGGTSGPPPKPSDAAAAAPSGPGAARPSIGGPSYPPLPPPPAQQQPRTLDAGDAPAEPPVSTDDVTRKAEQKRLQDEERKRDRELRESLKELQSQRQQDRDNLKLVATAFGAGGLLSLKERFTALKSAMDGLIDWLKRGANAPLPTPRATEAKDPVVTDPANNQPLVNAGPPRDGGNGDEIEQEAQAKLEAARDRLAGDEEHFKQDIAAHRSALRDATADLTKALKSAGKGIDIKDLDAAMDRRKRWPGDTHRRGQSPDGADDDDTETAKRLPDDERDTDPTVDSTKKRLKRLPSSQRGNGRPVLKRQWKHSQTKFAQWWRGKRGGAGGAGKPPVGPGGRGAASAAAGAGGRGAAAAGAGVGGSGGAAALAGPAVVAAAALAAVVVAGYATHKAFVALDHDAKDLGKRFKDVDPRLAVGNTQRELREFFNNMQRSQKIGDDVNAYLDASQRLDFALSKLADEFREPLLKLAIPILQRIADGVDFVSDVVDFMKQSGEKAYALLQIILDQLPLIDIGNERRAEANRILLKAIEINGRKEPPTIAKSLEDLFKMDGLDKSQKQEWKQPLNFNGGVGMAFGNP